MKASSARPVLGWREWISLPDLGVDRIKAKLDTGARSSSLHVFDLEIAAAAEKGEAALARFAVCPFQRDVSRVVRCEAAVLEYRDVRSSSGIVDRRPVVLTALRLAGVERPIEITLASRDAMGFRMLLGRQALRGRFVVDPAKSFLADRRRKRKAGS